jgi:mxaJ protein
LASSFAAEPLRVCADPSYLPFSNSAGQGFENKVANLVAGALGRAVDYTWASYRSHGGFPQFLASTLDAQKCDVVMSIPYGNQEELTTQPYYISSYVFIFAKSKQYDLTNMDSPLLRHVKVGFERETPAEDALKMRGLIPAAMAFDVAAENDESPAVMLNALASGKIDVLITWQPAISGFLHSYPELETETVPNSRTLGPPEQFAFPMSMGVRVGDEAMKKTLDDVIANHQAEITAILSESGVTLSAPRQVVQR